MDVKMTFTLWSAINPPTHLGEEASLASSKLIHFGVPVGLHMCVL